jgi:hypothetical protein
MENRKDQNKDAQKPADNQQGKKKKHVSALEAASLARSATERVSHHSNEGLADTGTNISYEGPTAPGGGGSVGTGYASGQSAAGEEIRTTNDDADTKATYKNKQSGRTEDANEEQENEEE